MKYLLSCICLVLLFACDSSPSDNGEPVVTIPEEVTYEYGEIAGYVSPAPRSSTVQLFAQDGTLLEVTNTTTDGYFKFRLNVASGTFVIQCDHNGLKEYVGGYSKAGSIITDLVYTEGRIQSANVTAFSALTYALGGDSISEWVGFDPLLTEPADLASDHYLDSEITPEVQYGLLVAAISQLTLSFENTDSQAFIELMLEDARADGVLDGLGFDATQLAFNDIGINGTTYRALLGVSFWQAANNPVNTTSVKGNEAIELARSFTETTSAAIGPGESAPIRPDFEYEVELTDKGNIFGRRLIPITSNAPESIQAISLLIAGNEIDGTVTASGGIISLDTNEIPDGEYNLKIQVFTFEQGLVEKEFTVTIFNEEPYITLTSEPISGNHEYTARVTVDGQKQGLSLVRIDSADTSINGIEFSAPIVLLAGENLLNVEAQFESRSPITASLKVIADLHPPSVVEELHELTTGYQTFYYNKFFDRAELRPQNIQSGFPLYCTLGSLTLDNLAVTQANLIDNRYAFLEGVVIDDFSSFNEIDVQYEVTLNAEVIKAYQGATLNANGHMIIPLTTEYLGEHIKTTKVDDLHSINIKVTDKTGNSQIKEFNFYMKVVNYGITGGSGNPEGEYVSGQIAYEPQGVFTDAQAVTLMFGDVTIDALNPMDPVFNFNSHLLGDGQSEFTIQVTTIYGYTYTQPISLIVDNTAPVIETSVDVEALSTSVVLTGNITDNASGLSVVEVNGESLEGHITQGYFNLEVAVTPGANEFEIVATDLMGNSTTTVVTVTLALNMPELDIDDAMFADQSVWVSREGQAVNEPWSFNTQVPIYMYPGIHDHDDLALSPVNLRGRDIPYLFFTGRVRKEDGTYINPEVSYVLLKNDLVVSPERVLPAYIDLQYLLPFTQEWFGDAWYESRPSDVFTLRVKLDGGEEVRTQEFQFSIANAVTRIDNPLTNSIVLSGTDNLVNFYGEDFVGITVAQIVIAGVTLTAEDPYFPEFAIDVSALDDGIQHALLKLYDRSGLRVYKFMTFTVHNE